jgi:hypothetical protein
VTPTPSPSMACNGNNILDAQDAEG